MGDDGLPLFRKEGNQPLLFGDQGVNLPALTVQKASYCLLFGEWWENDWQIFKFFKIETLPYSTSH
ncbi:hypothetical protein AA0472_0230 [Acetobacter estunensis NRIC 0472]|nr:hypothetical protein AA0472_0230 [Acetobacter estunensis NRIC 0472]